MDTLTPKDLSDELPQLLGVLRACSPNHLVTVPPRLRLIVDSNAILNDLRWCCRKRSVPNARTSLLEAAHSGIATFYAPNAVRAEVLDHFGEFESKFGIASEELHAAWAPYERSVKWLDPRTTRRGRRDVSRRTKRDPTDAPCVALSLQIGAPVLSSDRDYTSFGIAFFKPDATQALRGHARATVTEIRLTLVAGGIVAVSRGFVGAAAHAFRRLPAPIQILCGFSVIALLAQEGARQWLRRILEPLGDATFDVALEFACSLRTAQDERRRHTIAHLEPAKPQALADYIAVSMAESPRLLTTAEIAARVREEGYRTTSRAFCSVVGATLRRDPRFERRDGRWRVHGVGGSTGSVEATMRPAAPQ